MLQDVQEGCVSEESGRRLYGIILKTDAREVNVAATQKLREEVRAARKASGA